MAEISATPDLRDPLGAPNIITGTEYMGALAKLGYNVENMTSMLPTITKIADAGSSLLTNTYNQNMAYQKAQADLAYSKARTDELDVATAYNQGTLQYRINDAKAQSLRNQLDLDKAQRTQESSIAALLEEDRHKGVADRQSEQMSGIQLAQAQQKRDVDDQAYQLLQRATVQKPQALNDLPQPGDSDFEQKIVDNHTKYTDAWNDPSTSAYLNNEIDARRKARSTNLSAIQQATDAKSLFDAVQAKTLVLPRGTSIDDVSRDHNQAQRMIAQSNLNANLKRTTGLLQMVPKDPAQIAALPPQIRQQAQDLATFRDTIKQMLGAGGDPANLEQNISSILNGAHADLFDTDGSLNPGIEADFQMMGEYLKTVQKQAGEVKPPEVEHEVTAGPEGVKDVTKWQHLTAEQAQATVQQEQQKAEAAQLAQPTLNTVEQQNQALLSPATQRRMLRDPDYRRSVDQALATRRPIEEANREQLTMDMQQRMVLDPAFRDNVDRALTTGKPQDWDKVYDAMGLSVVAPGTYGPRGGRSGFQTGGAVDQTEALQPAQDLVTASIMASQQMANQPQQGYQTGGGVGPTDTVPAMLTPGEFVINQPAANAIGLDELNRLNQQGQTQPAQGQMTISSTPDLRNPLQPLPSLFQRGQGNPAQQGPAQQGPAQQGPAQQGPAQQGPAQTPAITTGPATQSIASTGGTGVNNPDINTTQNGVKITHYGYPGDASWDSNSAKGIGDRDNQLQGGISVALTLAMRQQLFGVASPTSTGKTFAWNGRTYRDDDTAPEADARIDVYNPDYAGVDKGVTAAQLAQRQEYAQLAGQRQGYQRGGQVYGYSPAARALGGNTPSIRADLSTLPEGNPLYSPSTGRQPVSAPGFQHGGFVTGEGGFGGGRGRGGAGGGGDENIFGGGTTGGGGGDWLPQQKQKRRRFHPKLPGQQGPDIPDEMQKKLAKLSHDYLTGLSGLIQARPEMGAQLLRHARNQIASNLGTGAEDEEQDGQGQQQDYGMPEQQYSPAQYAMTATGNEPT